MSRDFEDVLKIGRGGFSSVYAAKHKVDQQTYAIKKSVLQLSSSRSQPVNEELNRLLQEVWLFAAISHPNIIRYNNSWMEIAEEAKAAAELEPEVAEKDGAQSESSVELNTSCIAFAPRKNSNSSESRHDSSSAVVDPTHEEASPSISPVKYGTRSIT